MYAEHVLKLGVWNYQCDFLPDEVVNYVATPDVLRELVRVATAHNWRLLPNVHTIACEDDTPSVSISSHISHLFGPQLRAFRFEHHDPTKEPTFDEPPQAHVEHEEDITEMLRVVKMHAPQLVQLEIHVDPSSVSIVKALSDVALSCQSLVSFRCGAMNLPITPGALGHLALLPLLEYLSFTSVDGTFTVDEIRAFNRLPHAETFPRLRSFDSARQSRLGLIHRQTHLFSTSSTHRHRYIQRMCIGCLRSTVLPCPLQATQHPLSHIAARAIRRVPRRR
ncbi:hypothetical protein K466DRAFT_160374 [Polyporus arcularius HHB13444]|uniref:Uncharacterized protein n=1 Tax=Polyporus arcularius HHB13444 TaxID=1314778 RepID=A0A5C3Q3M9_9APHY|nr:hypothetical protein K466DRAFT_160374 [Polyporus arcularius HHB13444]